MNNSPDRILSVNCPTCRKTVEWLESNQFRPFCSERCKLIDLGAWASEEYRIPSQTPVLPDEFDDDDPAFH